MGSAGVGELRPCSLPIHRQREGAANAPAPSRARGGLLHTHAIGFHRRALGWLLPLLSRADEGPGTRLYPVDLELRAYVEAHAGATERLKREVDELKAAASA